ncbi:magnesium and cobalt transport protein CorA [Egicoccus sp. AB-alg2]|uniref:magnesium and cobalt transport protein CorA n=1 Tax=Egicoccus sp. AB-alg2 TaxID=3242693 RepID=UPI00359CF5C1
MEAVRFVDGRRVDQGPLEVQRTRVAADGGFLWVDVADPGHADLAHLTERTGLSAAALAVAAQDHVRPRLERHGDDLVVVLKTAVYVDPEEVIEVGQLALVLGHDVAVTLRRGPQPEPRPRANGDELDEALLRLGPVGLLAVVAGRVVRSYAVVLDGLDNDVEEIETQVFSGGRTSSAERIYRLKSEVQLFRWAVAALPDEFEELLDEFGDLLDRGGDEGAPGAPTDVLARLRGIRLEATRVGEHVTGLDELLNSALNAHLAQIGIRQNEDMRRISAWVAIVAVPTAIAGIYGMNFQHMPELGWRYGYFVVLGTMALICVVLYRLFKRSGWL